MAVKISLLSPILSSIVLVSCLPHRNSSELNNVPVLGKGILSDYNRDGVLDDQDRVASDWNWEKGGAFMMADIVDANRNKTPDYLDQGPRSQEMLKQFVTLRVEEVGSVKFSHNGGDHVLVFNQDGSQEIKSGQVLTGPQDLKIAAKYFAGMNGFKGYVNFQISGDNGTFTTTVRVAPWIMLPNSARTNKLYIASGRYRDSNKMQEDLAKQVNVQTFNTDKWQEMWMQDTIEIGYQEVPGKDLQYAALQADRCTDQECDRFAPTLISPTMGVFRIKSHPRKNYGNWDDWFGNLEVSHPTPRWPLGRIYHGRNLNDNLASILKLQEVQSPFVIDPTWLLIKHVDEYINFVADASGKAMVIVASPRKASEVDGNPLNAYNSNIQNMIDKDIAITLNSLGMDRSQVIELPMLYRAGGENKWSSPVNSVHLDRTVAVGNTSESGPLTVSQSLFGKATEEGFARAGIKVIWTDDRAYQPNHGNVHCGTNTLKEPVVKNYWKFPLGK